MEQFDSKLYWYRATCTNCVDGDTLDLELSVGFKTFIRERVRLYGINTPETYGVKKDSEEYKKGMLAKERTAGLILNKQVWVNTIKDKQEKYGRYLAIIHILDSSGNFVCLNDILLAEGLAVKMIY
jgi:micrococcal nuclease